MYNNKDFPYSYHTFLFPFLWNDGGKVKQNNFLKILDIGTRWIQTDWNDKDIFKNKCKHEWISDYAAYQYFTEPARVILLNSKDSGVLKSFRYKYKNKYLNNIGKYIIVKKQADKEKDKSKKEEDNPSELELNINDIKLNIYESGVAILIFELENFKHETLEEVNKINEYGRRINMPYIPNSTSHYLCADEIRLKFCDEDFACENYKHTLENIHNKGKTQISLNYVMSPIKKLIDGDGLNNGGLRVTTKKVVDGEVKASKKKANIYNKKYFIQPCVDDRMFVCCLIRDNKALYGLTKWIPSGEGGEYSYLNDCYKNNHKLSDDFYKTIFVETDISCVSRSMKKEILKKCVYDRWIDYKTLYACTHHSMFCFTGELPSLQPTVYNPFLTLYIQLAILVLVQRATILALSAKASGVSNNLEKNKKKKTTREHLAEIEDLQKKYVIAQNQLFISEATVQEQGVEIYELIREQLYIDSNKAELDEQMSNLRDVANIANERLERKADDSLNTTLLLFTIVGLSLSFIQTIPIFSSSEIILKCTNLKCLFLVFCIFIAFCVLTFILIKLIRRK